MEKHLHIISFDVPYPPDYGGVIDVFYKIKAFYEEGVKVHLHCYEYGRGEAKELKKYCESINYYKRNVSKKYLFNSKPYIVVTRSSEDLLKNLLKDNFPILFEGLHCTYFLDEPKLKNRKKIVRAHNIEHDYYNNLAKTEKDIFRKYYYYSEAYKLNRYEPVLKYATQIVTISKSDKLYFSSHFKNVTEIPAFHPNNEVKSKTGKGDFALYHANLSVAENNFAALYLVNNIFKTNVKLPLIIAGNKPSKVLINTAKNFPNVEIKDNISTTQIYELIQDAHINILPAFQPTGIKLKLLSALFTGRWCVVNTPMVKNTGLESLCIIKDKPETMRNAIISLFNNPFPDDEIQKRKKILLQDFNNRENIKKLIEVIF